ncbi:hypothetical protein [Actinokineospora terrae]|uniref:hypothetical protein n=1 Tax=Actinokineospora terrae TaxID=155974 RepID=UPI001160746F|nr:hypothetical protein [Actinokineospora terrae]
MVATTPASVLVGVAGPGDHGGPATDEHRLALPCTQARSDRPGGKPGDRIREKFDAGRPGEVSATCSGCREP